MKTIEYIIFTLFFALSIATGAEAQTVKFGAPPPTAAAEASGSRALRAAQEETETGVLFSLSLGDLWIDTAAADYARLRADGLNALSTEAGLPALPLWRRLVALPIGASCSVELLHDSPSLYSLPAGCRPLRPAPPAAGKETPAALAMDSAAYAADRYYGTPVVQLQELGMLQGQRLALLTIRPVAYNPATNRLLLHDSLRFILRHDGAGAKSLTRYRNGDDGSDLPPVYMVVSVDSFRTALQPFLRWKRQQGYAVEALYAPAWQRDTLRARLQARYDASTALHPAPAYLLLAGDAAQIPACQGTASISSLGQHATDLYYSEYTGDKLPDVLTGRFSAENTRQLDAIVQKTLAYEQLALADTAYLRRALLVAGKEERDGVDTLTNGQVNYLREALHEAAAADTHCFHNPASAQQHDAILAAWRQGAGTVNYTAHCLAEGWFQPQMNSSDIDALPADGRYSFVVNNCCHSNDFSASCFGEALLRKAGGGAVGVIGATYETLWDEDYYWATGAKLPFALHPSYDSLAPGAYDRLLHRRGEARPAQAATMGEMLTAGNCAVTEYGSPYAEYYWETYCLLGDPSLMPFIGQPAPLQLTVTAIDGQALPAARRWQDSLARGTAALTLNGTPYARVAVQQDSTLLGSCLLDSAGQGTLRLQPPILADSILLTATAQNKIPLIQTLPTRRTAAPRLTIESFALLDARGHATDRLISHDTMRLAVRWKNVGGSTARHCALSLSDTLAGGNTGSGDADATFQAHLLGSPCLLDSLPCDSLVKAVYPLVVHAAGQRGSGLGLSPTETGEALPGALTLYATGSDGTHSQTQPLRFDVERACIVLRSVRLRSATEADPHDNPPANRLLPGHDYWLELAAHNVNGSAARTSRLCVTHYEGGTFSSNCCHAGVALPAGRQDTLFLPLRTADTLSRLLLTVELDCDGSQTHHTVLFLPDSAMETFADGHFAHYPWDTLSALPWRIDSTAGHGDSRAARPARLSHRQCSELQLTLRVNARDTLAFWVKSSSEANADKLTFSIDETQRGSWSGQRDWQRVQYLVLPGTHTFSWRYEKDDSGSEGSDCAWIDDLRLPLSCLSAEAGYGDSTHADVSIERPAADAEVSFYPNPARREVTIANGAPTAADITLTDLQSHPRDHWTLPPLSRQTYALRHLPAGLYLLIIRNPLCTNIKKLLVIQ